jgi:hypothetical protein
MKDKIHILCPEYVPFENKGEEAIIRGTADILFENPNKCIYHVIDLYSDVYYKKNNICFHPGKLFFSKWRWQEFGLGPTWQQIYSSFCSLIRNGLNKYFPWWVIKPHKQAKNLRLYLSGKKSVPLKYRQSLEQLKNINYIIAGHDGGLDEYVCHIVNELHKVGFKYGIFGSCFKPSIHSKIALAVYRSMFTKSDFNIARNPMGYRWAVSNFRNISFDLKPDPAFGMIPASSAYIDQLLKNLGLESFFSKAVIMVTVAEPAPIARYSFDAILNPIHCCPV